MKRKDLIDYSILAILLFFIISTVVSFIQSSYILNINHYLGFFAWIITSTIKVSNKELGKKAIFILLFLGSLNLLNFTMESITIVFNIGKGSSEFNSIGLQPLSGILLIIYSIFNYKAISKLISVSKEEKDKNTHNTVNFYLNKFKECDYNELKDLSKYMNDYPVEGQIALKQLLNEKRI